MKYFVFPIMAAAIIISACSKENDPPLSPPESTDPTNPAIPTPEKLEIKISPSVVESRATDSEFENCDCVGLFVVNYSGANPGTLAAYGNQVDNMRFAYLGKWCPLYPVYWADETTHADFYLYYPYSSVGSTSAYPFNVRADQSTADAYKESDFMVGSATDVAPTANPIEIPATHVMSHIVVNLRPGDGFTEESLASAAVSVKINGVKCASTIDIATGAITPTGSPTTVTPLFENKAYKAVIVPQTVDECNLITVTVDTLEFNYKTAFTFKDANTHNLNVTLNKTSNGVNININPWNEDGIDYGGTAE